MLQTNPACLDKLISLSVAAMSGDFVVVVCTRPRTMPLAIFTMRKTITSFYEYGAPLKTNTIPTFFMKRFLVRPYIFCIQPGWNTTPFKGYHQHIKFVGTHYNYWVDRDTSRVKCLAQEHNTASSARVPTQTVLSGGERTNHKASAGGRNII